MKKIQNSRFFTRVLALALCLCSAVPMFSTGASASYRVSINRNPTVVDSYRGVDSRYVTYSSNTGTYCCAEYVKRFYQHVFGVEVHNLLRNATPQSGTRGCQFRRTWSPRPGDIMYQSNSHGGGHWAIIKAVNGSRLTLIEQNWKWNNTTTVERTVDLSQVKVFRLFRNGRDANNGGAAPSPTPSSNNSVTAQVEDLLFDADLYWSVNPDLQRVYSRGDVYGLRNHWVTCGQREGRTASVLFDAKTYLGLYPDLKAAFGNDYKAAYNHYVHFGIFEGRQASQFYNPKVYGGGLYPDLKAAFSNNPLGLARHFRDCGLNERRQASDQFSIDRYIRFQPDVARAFNSNPRQCLYHYIVYGKNEGRRCV